MVFFHCDYCNVDCKTRKAFDKHIVLSSHIYFVKLKKENLNHSSMNTKNIECADLKCSYCAKLYKHNTSLSRHITICPKKNNMLDVCNQFNIPLGIFKGLLHRLNTDPTSIEFLNDSATCPPIQPIAINTVTNSHNTTNTTNNTNSNNTTNNNIVMIMPFGQEDLSMITDEMRKNIITRGHCAYEHLLNEIYKHPQNHNVFYGNKRNKMVKYLDTDHKLRVKKEKEIIEDIVSTNVDRLDSFVDDHIESLDTKQKKYAGILKDIHSDKVVKRKKKEDYAVQTQCKLDEITPECRTTVKGQACIKNG